MEPDRPHKLEIKSTARDIMKEPMKAAMPIKFGPKDAPTPKRIADVAPKDAPEESPKIYGSACAIPHDLSACKFSKNL